MKNLALNLLLSATLVGCTAKIEGGSEPVSEKPEGFEDLIQGPDLTGKWASGCTYMKADDAYRRKSLDIDKRVVVRTDNLFTDKDCTQMQKKTENHGKFRWIKSTYYGGYQLEYKFDLGGGWSTTLKEELILDAGALYISDFHIGLGSIERDIPLTKAGSAPQKSKAEIAGGYDAAKFAFCSTQGFGTLIQFLSGDVSKPGYGKARMGYKVCGSKDKVQWDTRELNFAVILNEFNQPKIEFDGGSNIHPYDYQSGISGGQAANSLIGGNSGECYFLTNEATQGLPFIYKCE